MEDQNGILLIGEDLGCLHDIAAYITQRPSTSPVNWWTIDNKYYTANVPLRIKCDDFRKDTDVDDLCDAIVAVFDATNRESFRVLQRWWSECEPETDIKIIVALHDDSTIDNTAIDWATQQLVELVQVDLSRLRQSVEAIKDGRTQELKMQGCGESLTGMDRVVEVLQTHPWPGLTMKAKSHRHVSAGLMLEDIEDAELDDLDVIFQAIRGQYLFVCLLACLPACLLACSLVERTCTIVKLSLYLLCSSLLFYQISSQTWLIWIIRLRSIPLRNLF